MVLASKDVWSLLSGDLENAKAQQHGVDLSLLTIHSVKGGEILKSGNRVHAGEPLPTHRISTGISVYHLYPGNMYSVYFEQGITLPNNVKANIIHRSSLLRSGTLLMSAEYDPGFTCENLGAFMFVTAPLVLEIGARIAQIVCYQVMDGVVEYNGQYQNEGVK